MSQHGGNIRGQTLSTDASIGYLVMDLEVTAGAEGVAVAGAVAADIAKLVTNIKTRVVAS